DKMPVCVEIRAAKVVSHLDFPSCLPPRSPDHYRVSSLPACSKNLPPVPSVCDLLRIPDREPAEAHWRLRCPQASVPKCVAYRKWRFRSVRPSEPRQSDRRQAHRHRPWSSPFHHPLRSTPPSPCIFCCRG